MRSHFFLAGVITTAAAVALPQASGYPNNTASNRFRLQMSVPDPNYAHRALYAMKNNTSPELLLVGLRGSYLSGTEAYANNTKPEGSNGIDYVGVNMDVDGITYGLSAPSIGDSRGAADPVHAIEGWSSQEWTVFDTLNHKMAAGNNMLLACNRTVGDRELYVLSWGSMESDGSYPTGCGYTSVKVNCVAAWMDPGSVCTAPQ